MTLQALRALEDSTVIVGYKTYLALIDDLVSGKKVYTSGMGKEVERCLLAIEQALVGHDVALVSSGDSGVYGMAGLIYELLWERFENARLKITVIPGVTAANASAALLGAPLMNDWVVISLSDVITPWETIERRLIAAGDGDFVIALYNPRSKARATHLDRAVEILLEHRGAETPVGIVRNAYRVEQNVLLSTLGELASEEIDMFTTVIIGNSSTRNLVGRLVTVRGYHL